MSVRLVLVRHGEAGGNRELRYIGSSDVPLTSRGEAQARMLGEAVHAFAPVALYTSPLRRARETAAAIANGGNLVPQPLEALREADFGTWELLTAAEVRTRDPAALAAWETDAGVAPPGGESLADVTTRVVACANALAAEHEGATVALVSHVGPIKALVCATLGLPPEGARRMWLDTASVSLVEWRMATDGPSTGFLRLFNATTHLHALPRP
jgi:ribonuclease H / adenosylcobalamin/alpha-ribazole phosphatase